MIEIDGAGISNLIFHKTGGEIDVDELKDSTYSYDQEEEDLLLRVFLKPFTTQTETFEFTHDVDLDLNTLYKLSKDAQSGRDFVDSSKDIFTHLDSVSKHHNIKEGDLFILEYDNIKLNGDIYRGLGIYKVETKERFIDTEPNHEGAIGLNFKQGIGTRKLDKACLIVYTELSSTIFIIDNGSSDTDYWKNEFIKVKYRRDHVNSTNQFLTLTKSYITEQLPEEFEVTKADQINLLNKSVDYFKSHETFDKEDFEKDVFQDQALIDQFRNYDGVYREEREIAISDSFEISPQAVKKQARVFKSVLKLDKNFHIYIHGDRELIEQGVDTDGRKFYKIYYQSES